MKGLVVALYYVYAQFFKLLVRAMISFGYKIFQHQNYVKKKPHKRLFCCNSVNILILVLVPKIVFFRGIVWPNLFD